jgi:TolA-binding protein
MKLRFLTAALIALVVLPGCAYYNTFFNTKRAYKEAVDEHARRKDKEEKPSATEIQKLDKTIEKASRLLQLHPDSKYVDDALLMLGECFYYKQEYPKALRKFEELTANFPKSHLVPRAQLWKAQVHIAREDFKSAEAVLLDLQNQRKKDGVYNQAQYYLGEIYFRQEQYQKAAELYEQSAKRLEDRKTRAEAFMRLGESWYKLKVRCRGQSLCQASKGRDDRLQIQRQPLNTRAKGRRYDVALRKLNNMLGEFSSHPDISWVKFEIADITLQRGEVEEAMAAFAAINSNYKRTEASAAAFYALGNIFEEKRHDYEKAKENFDKVRTENARSEYTLSALEHSKAIDEFINLKNSIALLELQRGSAHRGNANGVAPQKAEARSGKPSKNRNTSIRRYPAQQLVLSNDPQKLQTDLANQRLNLADLFYQQLHLPDSAVQIYRDVIAEFGQTAAAPRALYSWALLLDEENPQASSRRDSLLNVLATQHAGTPHGVAARRRLGLVPSGARTETVENKFQQAEKAWLADQNPEEAIRLYNEFIAGQPDAEWQSKSLFAIGWIYETELAEKKLAYETYKQLVEKFPSSPYSQKVRRKVTAYDQHLKAEAQAVAAPKPDSTSAQPAVAAEEKAGGALPPDENLRKRIEADRQHPVDEKPVREEVQEELEEEDSTGQQNDAPPDP